MTKAYVAETSCSQLLYWICYVYAHQDQFTAINHIAMSLYNIKQCHINVIRTYVYQCHVSFMSLSCQCHVSVMSVSCQCHVSVMSVFCQFHVSVILCRAYSFSLHVHTYVRLDTVIGWLSFTESSILQSAWVRSSFWQCLPVMALDLYTRMCCYHSAVSLKDAHSCSSPFQPLTVENTGCKLASS